MTTKVVADDVLGQIARRQFELMRRVLQGTLDSAMVLKGLQSLIEGYVPEVLPIEQLGFSVNSVQALIKAKKWLLDMDDPGLSAWDPVFPFPTSLRFAGCTIDVYKRAFGKMGVQLECVRIAQIPTSAAWTFYPLNLQASLAGITKFPKADLREQEAVLVQGGCGMASVEETLDHLLDIAIWGWGRWQSRCPALVIEQLRHVTPLRCRNACADTPTFGEGGGSYPSQAGVCIHETGYKETRATKIVVREHCNHLHYHCLSC